MRLSLTAVSSFTVPVVRTVALRGNQYDVDDEGRCYTLNVFPPPSKLMLSPSVVTLVRI